MPLNIFDGSSWNPLKKVQIHDGTAWNESKAAYVWTGTEWKSLLDLKPKNTELPILSLQNGAFWYAAQETVSVSNGVWENSPTSFKYQWQKSAYSQSGYNWSNILNKTSSTLLFDEDEWATIRSLKYVGYAVRCKVTATNAAGDSTEDIFTLPSPLIGPQKLTVLTAAVVETAGIKQNGRIKLDWVKPIGANNFYIQYSGAASGEVALTGDVNTYEIDTGNGSGGLLVLVRPINTSNVSGINVEGLGLNASVSDVKPNKPAVTSSLVSKSSGGTFSWSLNLIQPTEWIIYNNGELYTSSYLSGLGASATSYEIDRIGAGGTTFGSFTITVTGTAPRFSDTSWSSSPALTITYPSVPLPVNQSAPTVSGTGRSFTSTNGTWSNSNSISSYIHEWYADGVTIPFGIGSSLSLGNTTQYDNKAITSSVYVLTTDLNTTAKTYSSNSVPSTTIAAEEPTSPIQYWGCCSNGGGVTGVYANSGAAITGLGQLCANDEPGNTLTGGVSKTAVCVAVNYTIPNLVGIYNPASTSNYNISVGASVATTDYTKEGVVSSQSPASGTIVSSPPIPTITVRKFAYQAPPDFPQEPPALPACPGTITNANAYTCNELGRTLLGNSTNYSISVGQQCCGDLVTCPSPGEWSAWSTCVSNSQSRTRTNYRYSTCTSYTETQTQSCTPPVVNVTYYAGYSLCNNNSGIYGSGSPTVSGPYSAASIPSDVIMGPSTAREVFRYRSTSEAALSAAAQAGCSAPPFFPPTFFSPPTFFDPPAFFDPPSFPVFNPPTFFDPPSFPVFNPPTFFDPPAFGGCNCETQGCSSGCCVACGGRLTNGECVPC
jgi:hypothetical protein